MSEQRNERDDANCNPARQSDYQDQTCKSRPQAKNDIRNLISILQAHQENTDNWLESDDAAVVNEIAWRYQITLGPAAQQQDAGAAKIKISPVYRCPLGDHPIFTYESGAIVPHYGANGKRCPASLTKYDPSAVQSGVVGAATPLQCECPARKDWNKLLTPPRHEVGWSARQQGCGWCGALAKDQDGEIAHYPSCPSVVAREALKTPCPCAELRRAAQKIHGECSTIRGGKHE